MSPDYPREKQPANVQHLQKVVSQAAAAKKVVAGRLQYWISTMAILGALERANEGREEPNHGLLLKGGVAMELRLGIKARTTKDVAFVFHGSLDALLEDLDGAFAEPHSGFAFERGEPSKSVTPIRTASTSRSPTARSASPGRRCRSKSHRPRSTLSRATRCRRSASTT